ncbi:E3 ubiquitin-protein transferase RMND5B-like [Dysidea avara]|uniref:E3 ubiquitin-protein transferase RMND5B-like n=1 Tax=Dysidea avara TaxID=196820 RepID=UPI00331E0E72
MDSCKAVESEFDKAVKKLSISTVGIEKTISKLAAFKDELKKNKEDASLTEGQRTSLEKLLKEASEACQNFSSQHKDSHGAISRMGKAIDRNFQMDVSACSKEGIFDGKDRMQHLYTALCNHLLLQGSMDIARCLIQEAGLQVNEAHLEKFHEMNIVLDALHRKSVDEALNWVEAHKMELSKMNTSLEFKLHRLKFIGLLDQGMLQEALQYSKLFGQFASHHKKEVQQLMGCFVYCHRGLQQSPYSDLLDPSHWTDAADTFTKDCCAILGLAMESPLSISLSAGCIALPILLQINMVIQQRQVNEVLANRDELPVEIDLGVEHRYHSIFACPILRQQTSETNPPVRLTCGHAISQDAMKKLVTPSGRLKCPYCPVEMLHEDTMIIHF